MDRRTLMMGAGAGVMAAGTYALVRPQGAPDFPLLPQPANAQETTAPATGAAPQVLEMVMGDPDAPVEVIEYASFTCPHCATFHRTTLPQIKANYIDTGKVRWIYREVYFDRFGLWAGMVARCAGPDRYFGLVALTYQRQAEWTQGPPGQVADNLRNIGRVAGLSNDQLDTCLSDAAMAEAMIATYESNMEIHDIPGTPHFVVDGDMQPNMSYADFAALLDERLAAAQ
jgi:protein-disulfide isomerase